MILLLLTDALKDSEKNKKIYHFKYEVVGKLCIAKQMTRKNIAPHTRVKRDLVRVDGAALGRTC